MARFATQVHEGILPTVDDTSQPAPKAKAKAMVKNTDSSDDDSDDASG